MTNVLFRKLKMYLAVLALLQKWIAVWGENEPFKTEVDALKAGVDEIHQLDEVEKKSKSVSEGKKQKKQTLIDAMLVICSAGKAYASKIKDNALKVKFDYSAADLKEGNEGELYTRCKNIITAGNENVDNLIKFNMPDHQLEIAAGFAEDYNETIPEPKEIISGHKSANKEMRSEFKNMDNLLDERLDGMVYTYKAAQPKFYIGYTDARFIGGWSKGTPEPPVPPVEPTPPMA